MDAEVSIAVGNHWIVVQAWDNHGNVYKAPGCWIDVTSGGGGGPTYSMIQAQLHKYSPNNEYATQQRVAYL